MTTTHSYASALHWSGRTDGYDSYSRQHDITMSGTTIAASADTAFRGDGALPNPEQLVVAAASSCQLLSFLAVAALASVEVLEYHDDARGIMPEDQRPMRLTAIVLRPRIVVRGATVERVERLLHKAHQQCYIANSLTTDVSIEPVIEVL
jgi:organic hydroperoxide reductase OsmC/OhrA